MARIGTAEFATTACGRWVGAIAVTLGLMLAPVSQASPPNILLIVADDLGYGELGSYGQEVIQTPSLDRLAAQGLRFTDFYAGAPVCAPSRSVLMTGKHAGHTRVRGNRDAQGHNVALSRDDVTIADTLQGHGYRTAIIGKWGLGDNGTTGHPQHQGFEHFFGYLDQIHAHNYYPEFLWRGQEQVTLANVMAGAEQSWLDELIGRLRHGLASQDDFGGGWATEKREYSHDLLMQEAFDWIAMDDERPFFLFLSLTIPHANNEAFQALGIGQEVPDVGPYADEDWPDQDKGHAAMITRMDRDIGRLVDELTRRGVADNTLVLFTSDNGPHREGGHNLERFHPSGPFRGIKRHVYEGGIRVPLIAWWPGSIAPGTLSQHVSYFGDVFSTLADVAGAEPPAGLDSISFAPTLLGKAQTRTHDHLYFEFYERGGAQAARMGRWKAVRSGIGTGAIELYDLQNDLGEANDVAALYPEVVAEMLGIFGQEHFADASWRVKGGRRTSPPPGTGEAFWADAVAPAGDEHGQLASVAGGSPLASLPMRFDAAMQNR